MFDKCGNASVVSVAKVIEGFWRRYLVVLGVDPYRDRAKLSQCCKALVDHPLPMSLINVPLYFVPNQRYFAENYAVVSHTVTE